MTFANNPGSGPMQRFEYKVVPAPKRGEKARGAKTTEDRFALALTNLMNSLGAEGWEYVRSDALPCEERTGFTGTKTTCQNMLVFRRALRSLNDDLPDRPSMRIFQAEPAPSLPKLGPAETPVGTAPAVGPAKADLAAE
jgi:hypothetical protein